MTQTMKKIYVQPQIKNVVFSPMPLMANSDVMNMKDYYTADNEVDNGGAGVLSRRDNVWYDDEE